MSQARKSDSLSSFEQITMDDVPLGTEQRAVGEEGAADQNPSPAGGAGAAQPPAEQSPAAGGPAASSTSPQAASGEHAPPGGPPAPPSSTQPPATQAFASVLGFFGGSGGDDGDQQAAAGGKEGEGQGQAAAGDDGLDAVAVFELEAMEAADKMAAAAEEVGHKLLHGAAEAKEAVASLAHGLTSWWANLDPVKGQSPDGGSGGAAGPGGSAPRRRSGPPQVDLSAAVEQLGLGAGETVLESFACQLWQTYTSTSNFFTPPRQVPFPGSLHVTSQRLCFVFEDRSVAPVKLPGGALRAVHKRAAEGPLPERIEADLEGAGQSLVLGDFALKELEMDSALALLEHLAESATAP